MWRRLSDKNIDQNKSNLTIDVKTYSRAVPASSWSCYNQQLIDWGVREYLKWCNVKSFEFGLRIKVTINFLIILAKSIVNMLDQSPKDKNYAIFKKCRWYHYSTILVKSFKVWKPNKSIYYHKVSKAYRSTPNNEKLQHHYWISINDNYRYYNSCTSTTSTI